MDSPSASAILANFSVTAISLNSMTYGNIRAFAIPWATLNWPPMAMAMACTAPRKPLAKASPASMLALAMWRRASRSLPLATARRKYLPMSRMASSARGIVIGCALLET